MMSRGGGDEKIKYILPFDNNNIPVGFINANEIRNNNPEIFTLEDLTYDNFLNIAKRYSNNPLFYILYDKENTSKALPYLIEGAPMADIDSESYNVSDSFDFFQATYRPIDYEIVINGKTYYIFYDGE